MRRRWEICALREPQGHKRDGTGHRSLPQPRWHPKMLTHKSASAVGLASSCFPKPVTHPSQRRGASPGSLPAPWGGGGEMLRNTSTRTHPGWGVWGMLPWWQAGSHRPSAKGTCLPALGLYRVSFYSSPSHQVTWPSPLPSLHIRPPYRHGSEDLLLLLPVADAILVLLRLLWVLLLPSEWNQVSPVVPAYGEVSWTVPMLIPPPQTSSLFGRGWCITVLGWGKRGPETPFQGWR